MNTRLQHAPLTLREPQRTIEDALAAEIRVPMAALRAALEGLAKNGGQDRDAMRVLEAAADEVGRLSLKVRTLIDAALAATPGHDACRLGELAEHLQRTLDPRARRAVRIACESPTSIVATDASRLSVAIAGLVEAFAREGSEVLVVMTDHDGFEARVYACKPGGKLQLNHGSLDGLRLSFAEHELEALGMRIAWRSTQSGAVRIALRADDADAFGGAA